MSDQASPKNTDPPIPVVREALRSELRSRGYDVASDTLGGRNELYVVGENDLARALFEFKPDPVEAMHTMYQGRWVDGMPPRFAVMPTPGDEASEMELLEQARIIPLTYDDVDGSIEFRHLDRLLDEHMP